MNCKSKYECFDPSIIKTYPISQRTNKVHLGDLAVPAKLPDTEAALSEKTKTYLDELALKMVETKKTGLPIILFTGAHLIKNGLGPLIADLVNRGYLSLVAGNGATSIHDFELAMIGETSEYVPQALEKGQFGMSYEFAYINAALKLGHKRKLGYGESLGLFISDADFRQSAMKLISDNCSGNIEFKHPEVSIINACWQKKFLLQFMWG